MNLTRVEYKLLYGEKTWSTSLHSHVLANFIFKEWNEQAPKEGFANVKFTLIEGTGIAAKGISLVCSRINHTSTQSIIHLT